jgi:hypothetical protein
MTKPMKTQGKIATVHQTSNLMNGQPVRATGGRIQPLPAPAPRPGARDPHPPLAPARAPATPTPRGGHPPAPLPIPVFPTPFSLSGTCTPPAKNRAIGDRAHGVGGVCRGL